ncbi:hypothetical protein Cyrtocomes_00679 [Candidatus Cyrtobacter comes]|uniref:Uncharacterized protein n=1 Tax=Candidatus Cyrtobacter comes TaxID=675776 RepID=A0ABU5L855_9RICK|nr:hypothetical protein [Candidatus Cyrtobacter comes]
MENKIEVTELGSVDALVMGGGGGTSENEKTRVPVIS